MKREGGGSSKIRKMIGQKSQDSIKNAISADSDHGFIFLRVRRGGGMERDGNTPLSIHDVTIRHRLCALRPIGVPRCLLQWHLKSDFDGENVSTEVRFCRMVSSGCTVRRLEKMFDP